MAKPTKTTVRYAYPQSRTNRITRSKQTSSDLLTIAGAVFDTEKWLHAGTRVTELAVPLYAFATYNRKLIENALADVLMYVLAETVRVVLTKDEQLPKPIRKMPELPSVEHICLFSGGTDSLTGLLRANGELVDVHGVFCAHSDQARIVKIVSALRGAASVGAQLKIHKVSVPAVGIHGYAQLRGFLYCVAAAAWMYLLNARTLLVTECGPTMYQPLFSPLDAVTMTTHPVVLRHARTVIEAVLGRRILLATPFEDATKAEVIALCPRPDLVPLSHSCISQRFGTHDGTCYGCIVRRLAAIAAGVTDVAYARNPINDERASGGNLMSLLTYCRDLLVTPGSMEPFEREKIERYGKHDLFRRFALDQFAALHVLRTANEPMRPGIRRMLDDVQSTVGVHGLESRLHQLRTLSVGIDWRRQPPM